MPSCPSLAVVVMVMPLPQDSLGLFGGPSSRRVIKPERIIIVRHGESLGNLDESVSELLTAIQYLTGNIISQSHTHT